MLELLFSFGMDSDVLSENEHIPHYSYETNRFFLHALVVLTVNGEISFRCRSVLELGRLPRDVRIRYHGIVVFSGLRIVNVR